MSLTPGTRLGLYEVIAKLGEGGMGEVYRARDTRLDRDVALKILPESFASDPDRLMRFEREAKTLASLNHSNIAQIYGFEAGPAEAGHHSSALVMELVEGEDLSTRIARGPIPLDEALPIAKQIAEALEAAHEQGIIHRDLKPANIKVRDDGTVKVLDFGLAKAMERLEGDGFSRRHAEGSEDAEASSLQTITSPAMTMRGVILGTAAYMSPEQARGKRVDKRADIWAFGVVLYEILTGTQAFPGEALTDVLAAVITREPDLSRLPGSTPPGVRALLARCLVKDSRDRLRDIGDARWLLDQHPDPVPPLNGSANRASRAVAIASAVLVVATIGVSATLINRRVEVAAPPLHLSMTFPTSEPQKGQPNPSLALSPDGRTLVYTAVGPEGTQLWLRHLNEFAGTPIAGTGASRSSLVGPAGFARQAFFSPDGKWIGFVAGDVLKKIPVTLGATATICEVFASVRGATWTDRNEIVFAAASGTGGLWRVSADGGTPIRVADGQFHYPDALPGGAAVVVTSDNGHAERSASDLTVEVVNLTTGARTRLFDGGTAARYVPTGHVVFARDGALLAARFDPATLTTGEARETVVPDLWMDPAVSSSNYAFSATGTLVYAAGSLSEFERRIVAITGDDVDGATPLVETRRYYAEPRLSPLGRQLVIGERAWRDRIWVIDLARDTATQLAHGRFPVWSPDGREIAFGSGGDTPGLSVIDADGSRAASLVYPSQNLPIPSAWARDGRRLVFTERNATTASDLMLLDLDKGNAVRPLLQTSFDESQGVLSADGQLIAFQSGRSGSTEIYVSEFPSMHGITQVSKDGGLYPVWAPNQRRLHYRKGRRVMAVEIGLLSGAISATRPVAVATFEATYPQAFVEPMSDGRFLSLQGANVATLPELRVIVNWFAELTAKVH